MASRLFVNNFSSALAESVASGDTVFDLVSASGLGSPSGGDYVACTIDDNAGTREIIHVTNVSTNTITCTRGQEGTSAQTWAGTETIEARLTKSGLDEKQAAISGLSITTATVATDDKVIIQDTSDSNNIKTVTAQAIADLAASLTTGTFTPVIEGTSTAGTGSYSTQIGRYAKIGTLCFLQILIDWNSHTGTGSFQITGLPFEGKAGYTSQQVTLNYAANSTSGNGTFYYLEITDSSTTGVLKLGSGVSSMGGWLAEADGVISISGCYFVD